MTFPGEMIQTVWSFSWWVTKLSGWKAIKWWMDLSMANC